MWILLAKSTGVVLVVPAAELLAGVSVVLLRVMPLTHGQFLCLDRLVVSHLALLLSLSHQIVLITIGESVRGIHGCIVGLGYRSKLLVQLAISRGLIELLLVGDVVRGLQRILLNGGVLSLVGRLEQHLLVLLLESLELLLLL